MALGGGGQRERKKLRDKGFGKIFPHHTPPPLLFPGEQRDPFPHDLPSLDGDGGMPVSPIHKVIKPKPKDLDGSRPLSFVRVKRLKSDGFLDPFSVFHVV